MNLFFWIALAELPLALIGILYIIFVVRNRKAIAALQEMQEKRLGNIPGVE